MRLSDFDYNLPQERIAHEPASDRSSSRLMILARQQDLPPHHTSFSHLGDFLHPGDLLVMNDTKVFPARLPALRESGGKVRLLLLRDQSEESKEPQAKEGREPQAKESKEQGEVWWSLAQSSRPLRAGERLRLPDERWAQILQRSPGGEYRLAFEPGLEVLTFLEEQGEVPLPPYIDPERASVDHRERYQTVYARTPGAVAAPTAGLHLTPHLLQQLQQQEIGLTWLTLHVGPGTFLPVRSPTIEKHQMHFEFFTIPNATVEAWHKTRQQGGRVIAVGTTSLRALEASCQQDGIPLPGAGRTDLFIYPGFSFSATDGLLTNFHLPRSTLLMLVAAFHGRERILAAYREAVAQHYRFYSYGDAMLIL